MRKALLMSVLASGVLFAEGYIHPDRMKNMADMETAMATIQKGFLFDNINVVKNGVKDLKATTKNIESFMRDDVDKNGVNNLMYAKKQAAAISSMADEISTTFAEGDSYSAANNYLLILSKCLSCHQTLRSW
jgi:cytochrome c556